MAKARSIVKTNEHTERWTLLRGDARSTKKLTWTGSGWIKEGRALSTFHKVGTLRVDNLETVRNLLIAAGPQTFIIHALPKPDTPKEDVRRRNENFDTEALHRLFVIDVDKAIEVAGLTIEKPLIETAARIAVGKLPPAFHGAECLAQATAGHGIEPGEARLRLFFWLDRPISHREASAWMVDVEGVDRSIYRPVQPIYIARPVFKGREDPITDRVVTIEGRPTVTVPAELPAIVKAKVERYAAVPDGVTFNSPHMLDAFVRLLHGRDAASIDSRHIAFYNAALDARDRAIGEDVAEALIAMWTFGDEVEDIAREALADAEVPPAHLEEIVGGVLRAHAKVAERMVEGDVIELDDVSRMVADAWAGAAHPAGNAFAEDTRGAAFGDVSALVDEDEGQPPAANDLPTRLRAALDRFREAAGIGTATRNNLAAVRHAMNAVGFSAKATDRVGRLLAEALASQAIDDDLAEIEKATRITIDEFRRVAKAGGDLGRLDDMDIASELIKEAAGDWFFSRAEKSWIIWDGTAWKLRPIEIVQMNDVPRIVRRLDPTYKLTASRVASIEAMARGREALQTLPGAFDADPLKLGTPAGVLDLKTGTLRPATRDDFIRRSTSVAPADAQDCPRFLRFMEEVTEGDDDFADFIQEWCGYCLTGLTHFERFASWTGAGRNGKSTLLESLRAILHDYATVIPVEAVLSSRNDQHPAGIAKLEGARLALVNEVPPGRTYAEGVLKAVTGGDIITARFMGKDFFDFPVRAKLNLTSNSEVGLKEVSRAITNRLVMMPFNAVIEKPDPFLKSTLVAEYPGILRWAIDGWLRLQKRGRLILPRVVQIANGEYLAGQDIIQMWIDDRCEVGPKLQANSGDLYGSYAAFTKSIGLPFAMTQPQLAAALKAKGYHPTEKTSVTLGRKRGFKGLALKDAFDAVEDEV